MPRSLASSPTKDREPEGLALLSTIHSPFSSPRMFEFTPRERSEPPLRVPHCNLDGSHPDPTKKADGQPSIADSIRRGYDGSQHR
jgi:hypothetical protein